MAELFGFSIQRKNRDTSGEKTFSTPTPDDGTVDIAGGGFFGQILDTTSRERTDLDLIRRYRNIAQQKLKEKFVMSLKKFCACLILKPKATTFFDAGMLMVESIITKLLTQRIQEKV